MASIRQLTTPNREGKRPWVVEYTDKDGKRRRKTPASGLKKDADILRKQIEREMDDGIHKPTSETVTFAEAAEAWRADAERRKVIKDRMSGNTFDNLCRRLRTHTVPALGHYKLTEIRTPIVQEYINRLIVTHSRGTARAIMQQIHQILELAVEREWLVVHPLISKRVRIPMKPGKEKLIPSHDEMMQILAGLVAPKREKQQHEVRMIRLVAITLALFTGLRRGEVLGLQWENVDFDRRQIFVRHSYSDIDGLKEPKTAAGIRSVPMAEPVYQVLRELRDRQPGAASGFVITRYGHPLSPKKLTIWVWHMMRDLGMVREDGTARYSVHTLRHCAVSLLIRQGLMPMHIQRVIGHASIKTTMDTYGHLLPGDDSSRLAIESVARQFSDVVPNLGTGVAMTTTRQGLKVAKRQKRDMAPNSLMITT